MEFKLEYPPINIGADISLKSFEMIEKELKNYEKIKEFKPEEVEIISRLIHTTTCFEEVLENIYFSEDSINKIKNLSQSDPIVMLKHFGPENPDLPKELYAPASTA